MELSREHIVSGFPVGQVAVLIHLVAGGVANVRTQSHRVLTGSRLLSKGDLVVGIVESIHGGCRKVARWTDNTHHVV